MHRDDIVCEVSYSVNSAAENVNLIFLQGLHHQHIIFPELSDQLALVRGPSEQDLTCKNVEKSNKNCKCLFSVFCDRFIQINALFLLLPFEVILDFLNGFLDSL